MSNYGLGYDGENGGLLRLRGKVIEKKVYYGFHTKTVEEKNRCKLPMQVCIHIVWKLFQILLFVLVQYKVS